MAAKIGRLDVSELTWQVFFCLMRGEDFGFPEISCAANENGFFQKDYQPFSFSQYFAQISIMKHCFWLTVFALLITSCAKPIEPADFQKSWRLSEVLSVSSPKAEQDEELRDKTERALVADGNVISFFPDNTYTQLNGYLLDDGAWEMQGDREVKLGQQSLKIDKIETVNGKTFLTGSLLKPKDGLTLKLKWTEDAKPLKNFKKDPFYPDNNRWRIKPNQKEDPAQIKERLLNYLLHYALILNASLERKTDVVSFAHSMGIVKIYRGGIGAIPWEKVKQDWIDCFYDAADAEQAYQIFNAQLEKGGFNGASTGEWVKDDYQILMAIYDKMKGK
jgi:hypothetical protein